MLARFRQVCGADRERSGEERRGADEREARVVWHVEPLVAVRNDRVRALDASGEMRRLPRRAREEPERAVDVEPRAVTLGEIGEGVDRIEVARVHLSGVPNDDRGRAVEP